MRTVFVGQQATSRHGRRRSGNGPAMSSASRSEPHGSCSWSAANASGFA